MPGMIEVFSPCAVRGAENTLLCSGVNRKKLPFFRWALRRVWVSAGPGF